MAELTVPQVNFAPLGDLGNVYKQAQADAVRQQTLAQLGQGGQVDADTLLRSGDLSLAQLGINLRNRQEEQARQAQLDQRQTLRDKEADRHTRVMEGFAARTANRADEGPVEQAAQRAKVAQQYGIDPNSAEGKAFILGGKLPDMTAPSNYEPNPDYGKVDGAPKLRPISGGPNDPTTVKALAEAKRGPDASFDDETISEMARQARAGDTSVFTNIGRGAQGPENLARLRREIVRQNKDEGVSGSEQALRNAEFFGVKAGQRTIGTKGANIEMAATEFNQVLPVVQSASNAVSRTNYPDLNKIILAAQSRTGDPNVVKFGGGVNTLINLYARAISPSGTPTVSDKDHAREILAAAWSQGQFDAAVGMMQQEIKAALASPEKVRDEMRARFLKGQGAAPVGYPAPGDPSASPKSVNINGYTITEH